MKIRHLWLLLTVGSLHAQQPVTPDYEWEEVPSFEITEKDTAESVGLKNQIIREYYIDETGLTEYAVDHLAMLLNSDKAIEEHNKVFLPRDVASSEIVKTKARVIDPSGEIQELNQSDILTAENEESGQSYQYFAFEGIKKGSIIEYYYTRKKFPQYRGRRYFFQHSFPMKDVSFDLYAPNSLMFEFKSYNGLADVELDTLYADENIAHWKLHEDLVSEIPLEQQVNINAHKKYMIYKLDRNIANGLREISSYAGISKQVYEFLISGISKSDYKKISKYIRKAEISSSWSEEKKVRAIEDYLKEKIHTIEANNREAGSVDFILKNNYTTKAGFVRFFAGCLKQLGVDFQIVLTSDRTDLPFDEEFEAESFLSDYLFYFPNIQKYLAPESVISRLGYPPFEYTDNFGLFIREATFGDFTTGVGKVKYIESIPYERNYDHLNVEVRFTENDPSEMDLHIDRTLGGYYAMFSQPVLDLVNEKTAKEITDAQINFLNEDFKLENKEVIHGNAGAFGIHPFQVKADVHTDAFVQKAGKNYLFKIGELIGPQMEMYQKKERKLPIESPYVRHYARTITFTVPEGYSVEGLEKLTIDNRESVEEDGKTDLLFTSSYTQNGNQIVVNVEEYYTVSTILLEDYEKYRGVVNSAADFNKITLVLVQQ